MNAVEISQVTKSFGKTVAVDGLSLVVPAGSIYGFIGPNGSGKTTTLRMIMNIFFPDQGRIRVLGSEDAAACKDRVGYLPEERGLYRGMRVRELLRFYGELKRGREVRQEVEWWLERLGAAAYATKKIEELSKGMAQKIQFIATVVFGPELVILDEPFTGLDPVNTDTLRGAILDLKAKGATIILSTHDMNVAETMCDSIFMIFKGRKVLDGTLAAIQDQYASNVIRIRTAGGAATLGELPEARLVRDYGQIQELLVAPGGDPQAILAAVMKRSPVLHFEITKPSLHDIFVRIAGPQAQAEAAQPGSTLPANN